MSQKKQVLGRGLSAILDGDQNSFGKANEVPVDSVHSGKYQPRQLFDDVPLRELAGSISEIGILQPILVRKDSAGGYEIVAGERRWRAAKLAKLRTVPVVIIDMADNRLYEAALIENVQRTDLNPIEEAKGIRELISRFSYTQEQISNKLGKSRSYVANTLRLLSLPEKIQNYVYEGKLTPGHARTLMLSDNPEAVADKIINENMSVREAENFTRNQKQNGDGYSPQHAENNDLSAIRETLQGILKTSVTIRCDGKAGYISIRFNSLEQLDDLITVFGR